MTQRLTEQQSETDSQSRSADPYASTRARIASAKKAQATNAQATNAHANSELKNWQVYTEDKQRQNIASFITFMSVAASIATVFSAMQGLIPWSGPSAVSAPVPAPATASVSATDTTYQPEIPVAEPKLTDDSGALDAYGRNGRVLGKCPLKHTSVDAKVSGYTARVTVKQVFRNPFQEKIEARYRFPLSHEGAVDDMTMKVGNRIVKGEIKRKEDAQQIYQQAKAAGYVASLLDQERTNVFTQSIANLESGKEIEVTIKYTEILQYKDGAFQFVFPTVVGERFDPYDPTNAKTDVVVGDNRFAKLTSLGPSTHTNTAPAGTRPGHDISLNVSVDEGLPITGINSHLHGIIAQRPTNHSAVVSLKQAAAIPNRDFVLDIGVAKEGLNSGYLTTCDGKDGFITIMVMPPKKVDTKQIAPRELVFLVDCSGSQAGKPIEKSRETLKYVVDHANDNDTFQIITFNDNVKTLFDKPEKLTMTRKLEAKMFIDRISALGGTWMAPAVEATCAMPADENRLRIVSFMTDGFVGNDYEVIGLVKKLRGTSRWFPFGVGDSVNRMLIDGISKEGGGESEFVLLNDSAEEVGRKFYERIASPVLTDVHLSSEGVELLDIYPRAVSDVWSDKPLYFNARYTKPAQGKVFINGYSQGKPYRQEIMLRLPAESSANSQIAQTWAKAKIDALMSEDYDGAQNGVMSEPIKNEIVKTALSHHLLSQFTSFVAVDRSAVTKGFAAASIDVPVNMAQGISDSMNTQASAPPAVASNTGMTYGCSYGNSTDTSNPVVNKVVSRAFARVTERLNSLSCAASCSAPSYAGASYSSPGASSNSPVSFSQTAGSTSSNPALDANLGDWVLLPWSLVPAPIRSAVIMTLVLLALIKTRRIVKQVRTLEELNQAELFWTLLLFTTAIALAIGHWNIANFPKT